MKLSTQEKIVMACLTYHNTFTYQKTIAEQCNLQNYPYEQLFKMMVRKNILLSRKNIDTGKLFYAINPAFLAGTELKNKANELVAMKMKALT